MLSNLYIVQANMRKSRETTHSFFHDPDFEQTSLILFTEPYASRDSTGLPASVLLYHTRWQPFYPTQLCHPTPNRATRAPFRSMI